MTKTNLLIPLLLLGAAGAPAQVRLAPRPPGLSAPAGPAPAPAPAPELDSLAGRFRSLASQIAAARGAVEVRDLSARLAATRRDLARLPRRLRIHPQFAAVKRAADETQAGLRTKIAASKPRPAVSEDPAAARARRIAELYEKDWQRLQARLAATDPADAAALDKLRRTADLLSRGAARLARGPAAAAARRSEALRRDFERRVRLRRGELPSYRGRGGSRPAYE